MPGARIYLLGDAIVGDNVRTDEHGEATLLLKPGEYRFLTDAGRAVRFEIYGDERGQRVIELIGEQATGGK